MTIDRPASRNAIGLETIVELRDTLDMAEKSPNAAVLVIRGAGERAFVSGGDLKELSSIRTKSAAMQMATQVRSLLDRVASFPIPVIAALNGHALGGGAEVAVAADVRVAAADTQIGFTQTTLGIMPAWGGAERLAEIVGRSKAVLLIATAARLSAAEALDIGLVDLVMDRKHFDAGWGTLAQQIAEVGPQASRSIKQVISVVRPHVHKVSAPDAVEAFAELWISQRHWDLVEAMERKRIESKQVRSS